MVFLTMLISSKPMSPQDSVVCSLLKLEVIRTEHKRGQESPLMNKKGLKVPSHQIRSA